MRATRPFAPLVVVLLLLAPGARADAGGGATPDPTLARLEFAMARLDARRTHARAWAWSWTAVNGSAAVALGVMGALADEPADQVNFWSQSLLAGLGVADVQWIRPIPGRDGADPIRRFLSETSDADEALARAERLLRQSARREEERTRWPLHLANVALNAAAGLAVWAAGSGTDGLIAALSGIAGGELYLWSEPYGRRRDLADFEREAAVSLPSRRPGWSLAPTRRGIALRYDF